MLNKLFKKISLMTKIPTANMFMMEYVYKPIAVIAVFQIE